MERRRPRHSRLTFLASLVLAGVLFIAVNIVAGAKLNGIRADLTEDRLYTVSKGTRQVLRTIDEPLHARFFYSSEMANGYPQVQAYASRVKALLRQYETISRGKFTVDFIDPQPFTEAEDQAMTLGIQGAPIDRAGNRLFFGLAVTNAVDDTAIVPFFDPGREQFIEYDLARLIDKLKRAKPITLGVMSWLPLKGTMMTLEQSSGPWAIWEQLKQYFNVEQLETHLGTIPANVDVLMVVHPATIDVETMKAIDQFVLRGGKLVALLDPHLEMIAFPEKSSSLRPLLDAWGVSMSRAVAADTDAAISVSTGRNVTSLEQAPNVTWLDLGRDNFNPKEVTTASLKELRMATVGAFERTREDSLDMVPLVRTGDSAFYVAQEKLQFADDNPTLLMEGMSPSDHRLNLAVRLSGVAKTAFPDDDTPGHLAKSVKPVSIVLIGDTDFLRDGFWAKRSNVSGSKVLTPTADNGAFVGNVIEFLGGDSALLSLRTRAGSARDFVVVKKLRATAEARFRKEEEALRVKMGDLERNLRDAQTADDGSLLSDRDAGMVAKFRDEMLETRKQLRDVRHSLEEEIERLGFRLKLINIGLMPLFVLILAFFLPKRLGLRRS